MFRFGNATFHGSMAGQPLNASIAGIVATGSGQGYWLVGADGGVFTFGDAGFWGATHGRTPSPIFGFFPSKSGLGYYLLARDGGIIDLGDAVFHGSTLVK